MKKPAKVFAAAAALALAGCAVVPTRYGTAVEALPAPGPIFGPVPAFAAPPLAPVPFDLPMVSLPPLACGPSVVAGPYGLPETVPNFCF